MKINRMGLTLSCALMMAGGSAHAEEYRLAFSKGEQIEIIINNANQDSWCSAKLKLEARYQATPNPEGLARLMPKIGQLMKTQCPQATQLSWISTSHGKQLASGNSSAATGWVLNIDPEAAEEQQKTNDIAAAPASETPLASAKKPTEAESNQAGSKVASAEATAEKPAQNTTTSFLAQIRKTEEKTTESPIANVTAAQTEAPANEPRLPVTPKLAFEVKGWKPNANTQEVLKTAKLTEVVDQNGCKLLVSLENTSLNLEYTQFKTEGLDCHDNIAQGAAKASVVRSDGNILNRASDYHFSKGLALNAELADLDSLHIVAANENGHQLWLYLGEDPDEKTYYLLGLSKGWGSSPFGPWSISGLDIITEQNDIFRKQNHIIEQVNKALRQHPWLQEKANNLKVSFFSDFKRGLLENQLQGKLYSTNLYRNYDWRKKQLPPWNLTALQGNNYLFQKDEEAKREAARLAQEAMWKKQQEERQRIYEQQRLARQKQQALYAIASQEERNLQQFNGFEKALQNGDKNLLAQNLSGIEFTPFGRSDYYRLMHGRSKEVSLLVRIDKVDNDAVQANWPYPLKLSSPVQLEKGWYWVNGKASLDKNQTETDKLPVIQVVIDSPSHLLKCEQALCKDLENPLALTRLASKNANWDIAHAQSVIREYEEAKKASY